MLETFISSGWGPLFHSLAVIAIGVLVERLYAPRDAAQLARVRGDAPDVLADLVPARPSLLRAPVANDNAIDPAMPATPDAETLPPVAVSGFRSASSATGVERPRALRRSA